MAGPTLREEALAIWQAGLAAVDPARLVAAVLGDSASPVSQAVRTARRILVVGGGKAGTPMVLATEAALAARLGQVGGWVNVPAGTEQATQRIRLHAARPAGSNHPAEEGVQGVREMLARVATLEPEDLVLCLLSGGGSALLPAPAEGLTLDDKQRTNRLLHACGATINELNCVRKHLSAFKGGRLAQAVAARGCPLFSLILSDVVGDPLDVIASGPTAADPTTFTEARAVFARHGLLEQVPADVLAHLDRGITGELPETLKTELPGVTNLVVGSNRLALNAACAEANRRGYRVLDLGAFLEGEASQLALMHLGLIRSIRRDGVPAPPRVCLLSGGETTVTLSHDAGKGGRNQEFVLAMLERLNDTDMKGLCLLSGGTDGEDGPTDAAGALADAGTRQRGVRAGLNLTEHLRQHDAYPYFAATGDLLLTGPTGTNVADVRVILVHE